MIFSDNGVLRYVELLTERVVLSETPNGPMKLRGDEQREAVVKDQEGATSTPVRRREKTPMNETQIEGHEEAMGVSDVNARSGL